MGRLLRLVRRGRRATGQAWGRYPMPKGVFMVDMHRFNIRSLKAWAVCAALLLVVSVAFAQAVTAAGRAVNVGLPVEDDEKADMPGFSTMPSAARYRFSAARWTP